MRFYTVWVRSQAYRGKALLTYSHDGGGVLAPGTIVQVPLQRELVPGIIDAAVTKPAFATRAIAYVSPIKSLPDATLHLLRWLREYYATTVGVATQQVLPAALPKTIPAVSDSVVNTTEQVPPPPLTAEQSAVVKHITKPDTYVLHGRTGSGKTRVYLELASQQRQAGRSSLILTPEISLTSQLARAFRSAFGDETVVVLHSQLTPKQRQTAWLQIAQTSQPLIVIGPRSALFSPVHELGLIVIDEAHEPAYKQEQAPYYQARTVASRLAELHHALLIIGSATPSINDYFLAEHRQKPILPMTALAADTGQPALTTELVDLKDRAQFSRSHYLSQPLIAAIRSALSRGEQALLYLNRRGTARVVLCERCGWQALCPHCDLPLVYHADSGRFRCHTCGFSQPMLASCPTCGNPAISFKSFGTKAVTTEVQRLFPEARVQRFDTDNKASERFEHHYEAIRNGNVNILVGTQLLAKGLDLPKLSTLGIVLADSSLYMPDFSAQERTFQLISQALGRVGRGHLAGHAVIQTYHPDSPVLQAAQAGDWDAFYANELAERQKFHFPPFYFLLKLSCRRASYQSAETAANKLKQAIASQLPEISIDGPAPAFHEKSAGKFECQLVLRSRQRQQLIAAIGLLPASGWSYDIDPINLL